MRPLPRLAGLFRLATGRPGPATEVEEELALHLDLLTDELMAEGLPPESARREAERRFGNRSELSSTIRRIDAGAHRDRHRRETFGRLVREVRIAARTLTRQPVFALGGMLIVALGIGCATAMFTVLNAAFLRPFPYLDPDQMMFVFERTQSGEKMRVAGPNATDWARETRLFSSLAYYREGQTVLTVGDESAYLREAEVSRPFRSVLGLEPLRGRWFAEDEARVGGSSVAVISERLWRGRFGSDTALVGRTVTMDGLPVAVVGIMPAGFAFPSGTELWRPAEPSNTRPSRTAHNWRVVARLAPGLTREAAEPELSALTRRLVAEVGKIDDFVASGAVVVPFREQLTGGSRRVLLLLQGAVLLVLLIAAVNLTNLTLARAARRQGEVTVCLALGARRADLIRRFAAENLIVTLVGGGAGFLLAALLRGVLVRWAGRMLPFVSELPLDLRVAGFALGLAVAVGLCSSLIPALRSGGGPPLVSASRGTTPGRSSRRVIDALMGAEVAMAVILVSCSALVGRSLLRLSGVNPGFSVEGRVVAQVPLRRGQGAEPTAEAATLAYDRLLEELRAVPGTRAVAATAQMPLWGYNPNGSAQVEGTPSASGGPPAISEFRVVSPGFFAAIEIPVVSGREFSQFDASGAPYVAVVNQRFVQKHLDGGNALGRRVRFPGMDSSEDQWATIVGVVGDTRQEGLAVEPEPAIYYSYRQRNQWPLAVVVFSSQLATAVLADLKTRLAQLDRAMPFSGRVWQDVVDDGLALPRIRSILLMVFALIALALSAAGIGAVVAFAVAQRTREFGLRIAVGAAPAALTRDGVLRAARPMVVGVVVGLFAAIGLGRAAAALLYGLAPNDPGTLAFAAGLTLAIGLLAAYIPARRAPRVDPMTVLRVE